MFHVERKLCRSQLFIETKDMVFYQDPLTQDPPMDHFVSVPEDLHTGGLVVEIPLTDAFSTGPSFSVTVMRGWCKLVSSISRIMAWRKDS